MFVMNRNQIYWIPCNSLTVGQVENFKAFEKLKIWVKHIVHVCDCSKPSAVGQQSEDFLIWGEGYSWGTRGCRGWVGGMSLVYWHQPRVAHGQRDWLGGLWWMHGSIHSSINPIHLLRYGENSYLDFYPESFGFWSFGNYEGAPIHSVGGNYHPFIQWWTTITYS